MDRAIHWFLHKFNVDLAACLMCPVTAPTQHLHPFTGHMQQLRTFPFLNEDIIMDGLCLELPARLRHTLLVRKVFHLIKADSMADLDAKKVESGGDRKRIDNLPIGQAQ